jgi:tetratricopeptide (TPR) repeat protein
MKIVGPAGEGGRIEASEEEGKQKRRGRRITVTNEIISHQEIREIRKKSRWVMSFAAAAGAAFLAGCAPAPVPRAAPPAEAAAAVPAPPPDAEEQITKAGFLTGRGSYLQLQQAYEIYDRLYPFAALRPRLAAPLLETALLLAAREKELGIWNPGFIGRALELLAKNPTLAEYRLWVDIAGVLWPKGKGVVPSADERFPPDQVEPRLEAADAELAAQARRSPVFAYLYATYKWYDPKPLEKAEGLDAVLRPFPESLLLKYKKAVCPAENDPLLEALIAEEPEFLEAHFHQGGISLARGKLVEAEERLLKALPALSRSQALLLRLATVYFAFEEVEDSLAYFEKTLQVFAENRDAFLGKAICLSVLGRSDEALAVLESMLASGNTLIGEVHYWEAWNFHEKKDLETAASHVVEAKKRLPTAAEVFALSGLLELERGNLDAAEKELLKSLEFNGADADVIYNVGKVYGLKSRWFDSATFYRTSGFVYGENAKSLTAKMDEIRESRLAEGRKARLLRKKEAQLRRAEISKATAFYNAAAGYANAGSYVLAIAAARDAAAHPAMAERAEELIALIKKR